jgi:hypothetical protein
MTHKNAVAGLFHSDAEVYILHSVAKSLIETFDSVKNISFYDHAGCSGRIPLFPRAFGRISPVFVGVGRHAFQVEKDAGMVDQSGTGIGLDVSDRASIGLGNEQAQHGFNPSGCQDQVVVEETKHVRRGCCDPPVHRTGVSSVFRQTY